MKAMSALERALKAERMVEYLDKMQQQMMQAMTAQKEMISAATGYRDEMEAALEEFAKWVWEIGVEGEDGSPPAPNPEADDIIEKLRELKLWRSKADKVFQALIGPNCCAAASHFDGMLVPPDTPVPLRDCTSNGACGCVLIDQ